MHIHEVLFQVVDRQDDVIDDEESGTVRVNDRGAEPTEPWEDGWKDTVIARPGQVTRLRMKFTTPASSSGTAHRRARGKRDDAAVPDRTDQPGSPHSSVASNRSALRLLARHRRAVTRPYG